MDFQIKNIDAMIVFLRSVLQVVPGQIAGAKFEVGVEATEVKVVNESKTVRSYFTTNSITAAEDTIFYFQDITKLLKSIILIKDIEGNATPTLKFDGQFLRYSNTIKFKLKVVKSEAIERYCTKPITATLTPIYSFVTGQSQLKKIVQCTGIVDDTEAQIYLSKHNDTIIAEIDDKKSKLTDSVGLPISNQINGDVEDVICVNFDNFKLFTVLPVDNIVVILTDKKVLMVNSKYQNGDSYIDMNMICSLSKG
jgi:hypothetical protein